MSLSFWKKNIKYRPDIKLPNVSLFAQEKNKPITIYDIESTGLLNYERFGITENAMLHVFPDGKIFVATSLVNPEYKIPQKVIEITQIKNEDVRGLLNWGALWAEAMAFIAKEHIVLGFNNLSFDDLGVIKENLRYHSSAVNFQESYDLRSLLKRIHGKSKGTLGDYLKMYDLKYKGQSHRALVDVVASAELMDKLIDEHGTKLFNIPEARLPANTIKVAKNQPTLADRFQELEDGKKEKIVVNEEISLMGKVGDQLAPLVDFYKSNVDHGFKNAMDTLGFKGVDVFMLTFDALRLGLLNSVDIVIPDTQLYLLKNKNLINDLIEKKKAVSLADIKKLWEEHEIDPIQARFFVRSAQQGVNIIAWCESKGLLKRVSSSENMNT